MIVWITGKSGSGKTTLAKDLMVKLQGINLDGNEMRESISQGAGFSPEDRLRHNVKIARLAKVLERQMPVVVSLICPLNGIRDRVDSICSPIWIYLKRTLPDKRGHIFEEPPDSFKTIDVDELDEGKVLEEALEIIRGEDSSKVPVLP